MKQIIFICLLGLSLAAKLDNTYLPPSHAGSSGGNQFLSTPYQTSQGQMSGFPSRTSSYDAPISQLYQEPHQKYSSNRVNGGYHSQGNQRYTSSQSGSYNGGYRGGNSGFSGQQSYSSYPQSSDNIIKYNNQNNGDGTYQFEFETENKISQKEVGQLQNAGTDAESSVVQGDYSYVSPEGKTISVQYIADENGFRATGDHISAGSGNQVGGYSQSNSLGYNHGGNTGSSFNRDIGYGGKNTYNYPGSAQSHGGNTGGSFDRNIGYGGKKAYNYPGSAQNVHFSNQNAYRKDSNLNYNNQNAGRRDFTHSNSGQGVGQTGFSNFGNQGRTSQSGSYGGSGKSVDRQYLPPDNYHQGY